MPITVSVCMILVVVTLVLIVFYAFILAELVAYVKDARTVEIVAPILKLVDLVKLYNCST